MGVAAALCVYTTRIHGKVALAGGEAHNERGAAFVPTHLLPFFFSIPPSHFDAELIDQTYVTHPLLRLVFVSRWTFFLCLLHPCYREERFAVYLELKNFPKPYVYCRDADAFFCSEKRVALYTGR